MTTHPFPLVLPGGAWSPPPSRCLNTRQSHRSSLLGDGRVLVSGGSGSLGQLASAELYDPGTGTWSATGSLSTARASHSSTLLVDGEVLVVGGWIGGTTTISCELYAPTTGTWSATGSLPIAPRQQHTATLLGAARSRPPSRAGGAGRRLGAW